MTGVGLRVSARVVLLALPLVISGCGETDQPALAVPMPDMTDMEPQVAARLRELERGIEASPRSAEAWGRLGMVMHAHELLDEAATVYARARELDPADERWPYYHGEVLSILGTDLEAAESAFSRFMELHPDYGPAHMRLGKVLVAQGRSEEASLQFERALELEPRLQPAQVALAQLELADGELEAAEQLLEQVLAESPRHEQALTTLGQVYMRQGRRDEAREVAARATHAAAYNLYSDPLMSKMVAEELSSAQIWERAKSFLEHGNYEQAAIGLARVVELTPDNASAHVQLAVAYGHLGRSDRALQHLERSIALEPDSADARTRLGALYLELERPADAVEHLRAVIDLEPEESEAHWLLGRALLRTGGSANAIRVFDSARAAGMSVPPSAHNDWGNALAQTGRPEEALSHFEAALHENPEDPQALFFSGLVYEGRGDLERAVRNYCRSLASDAGSPARQRLQALDRFCD